MKTKNEEITCRFHGQVIFFCLIKNNEVDHLNYRMLYL